MLLTNGPSGTDSNHNLDNDFGSEYRGRDPQQGQQSSNWPPGTRSGDTNSVLTTQTGGGGGGTKRLRSPAAQYVIPPNKVVSVSQQQFQQKQYHQPPSESHVGSTYSDRINGMSNNNTGGNSQAQFRPTATRQPPPALLRAPSPSAGWLQSRPATPNPRS